MARNDTSWITVFDEFIDSVCKEVLMLKTREWQNLSKDRRKFKV